MTSFEWCFICANAINNSANEDGVSNYDFLCSICDRDFGGCIQLFRLLQIDLILTQYSLNGDFIFAREACDQIINDFETFNGDFILDKEFNIVYSITQNVKIHIQNDVFQTKHKILSMHEHCNDIEDSQSNPFSPHNTEIPNYQSSHNESQLINIEHCNYIEDSQSNSFSQHNLEIPKYRPSHNESHLIKINFVKSIIPTCFQLTINKCRYTIGHNKLRSLKQKLNKTSTKGNVKMLKSQGISKFQVHSPTNLHRINEPFLVNFKRRKKFDMVNMVRRDYLCHGEYTFAIQTKFLRFFAVLLRQIKCYHGMAYQAWSINYLLSNYKRRKKNLSILCVINDDNSLST